MRFSSKQFNKPKSVFWIYSLIAAAGAFVICSSLWDVLRIGDSWTSEVSALSGGLTLLCLSVSQLCLSVSQMLLEHRTVLGYALISAGLGSGILSLITAFMG